MALLSTVQSPPTPPLCMGSTRPSIINIPCKLSRGHVSLPSKTDHLVLSARHGRRTPSLVVCSAARLENNNVGVAVKKPATVPAQVSLGRSSFPPGFVFGAASSAYQVEGAWNEGGRGPSIWDTFSQQGNINDKTNGDIATASYYKYKEDIKIMKDMGVDSYRFSISWSRIFPNGTKKGGINEEGIKYYNDLINELLSNGIKPFVTIFHWDVPQALEDAYGGFMNKQIVDDFKDFARICFEKFGDKVKYWITLNEPWTFSTQGYCSGDHAPGKQYNSYDVTHHLILAHAEAAKLYKEEFEATQKGKIGITHNSMWFEPLATEGNKGEEDKAAADRAIEFMLGWFMHPIVYGDYPPIMKKDLGNRLPSFTDQEKEKIKKSYDFIGLNYYTSRYVTAIPELWPNYFGDWHFREQIEIPHAVSILKPENDSWIHVFPRGLKNLLVHLKDKYQDPDIYITENGTFEQNDPQLPLDEALKDNDRIDYLKEHLAQVREATFEEVNVKGYFAWSLTDNFEWKEGYKHRFGLVYIDYANGVKRYLKDSAKWYTRFLKS